MMKSISAAFSLIRKIIRERRRPARPDTTSLGAAYIAYGLSLQFGARFRDKPKHLRKRPIVIDWQCELQAWPNAALVVVAADRKELTAMNGTDAYAKRWPGRLVVYHGIGGVTHYRTSHGTTIRRPMPPVPPRGAV